jgi:hypothetical protein
MAGMDDKPLRLSEVLARIDQWLAEAEAMTALPVDDETRQGIQITLAELRQARKDVEAKLS